GQFASVSRCRSRDTGQQFAAKFSSRARYGEDCSAEIHHEIALLSLCSPSSRVIRLHDVFETPTEIILVLEFAPGGDLQTIIDDNLVPFEADVVKFVRQLVEGLVYLHERKVAHLDIKPQNLVMMADFPDCDVKLCDFEISRVILEGIEIREILGTPDYVAPEILHYEPITLKADMWSLGVTTYVLLTGFSPFGGETDQETFCNISRAEVDFPEELFEDVSEEARDFIRCLLVRDPGARPSAKECLRHKWLSKKIPRTSTPPSLLRQDSSLVATKATTRAASPSEDSTRMSQRNATQQQKNLRKYLSKSREALFERVVQQQQQHQKNNLRKTTLLSQYHKTRRLCESQMSLVSKSRERLLMMDHQMSPHISRSREKLYGLRSLSKSHEVLDLCKSAAATGGQAPHGVGLGILKTLTRATTADLSMIPLLRQRLMGHGSSTTSISSSVTTEHDTEETSVPLPPSEHVKFSRMCSVPVSAITSPITPSPLHELLENSSQSPNSATKSQIIPTPTEDNLREKNMEHITQIPALLSPKLLKETIKNQSKFEMFSSSPLPVCEANLIPHEEQNEFKTPDGTASLKTQTGDTCTWEKNEARTDAFDGTEIDCTSSYQDDGPGEDIKSEEEPKLKYEDAGKHTDLPQEIVLNQQDIPNTSESTTETRAENKNEASVCIKNCEDVTEEDSEPRYTVAQLVSAFNRHQEVVTKTSLEVTMTTSDKGTKIPPMIFNTGNSAFP
ncbi:Serine/threonine-protein kinase 17B, partial [Cryptotermes secundus]